MTIIADTNVLLRAIVRDDTRQGPIARAALDEASSVAIPIIALCEMCWVLTKRYKHKPADVAIAVRRLVSGDKVITDQQAVEAGLAMLDAGGDFADGAIAHEGRALGGGTFVSFDKGASAMLKRAGVKVKVLG